MIRTQAFTRFARSTAFAAACALAATSIAPATAATDPTGGVIPTPSATKSAKPKKYCAETEIVGTRIRHRECKTRAEWIRDNGFDPEK